MVEKEGNKKNLEDKVVKKSLTDEAISDMMVEHLSLAHDAITTTLKLHLDKVYTASIALPDEETVVTIKQIDMDLDKICLELDSLISRYRSMRQRSMN